MQWITREHAQVDRVACPGLVQRFVEKDAEFLYMKADTVTAEAARTGATPYDIKGVEIVVRFLAIMLVCAACGSPSVAGSPSPTTALASPTSVASASARTTLTPAVGRCTGPNVTATQLIERLFALSTSRDARAVLDCYAESKRVEAGFDDFAARWSTSGPATGVAIRFIDRVKGCDRFGTNATLAHGDVVGYSAEHSTFFSIGSEQGLLRIYDAGTALASAEVTLITCG